MTGNPMNLNKTVRAIIVNDEKILLGREKGERWYFLPGWRVGRGEKSEFALENNIREKLKAGIEDMRYIGATSSVYRIDKYRTHQEFDLVYIVKLQETNNYFETGNVEFVWQEIGKFSEENILPKIIKSKLVEWFETKKTFWASV